MAFADAGRPLSPADPARTRRARFWPRRDAGARPGTPVSRPPHVPSRRARLLLVSRTLVLGVSLLLGAAGCGPGRIPERSVNFHTRPEAVRAAREFLSLERSGVDLIHVTDSPEAGRVPPPHYLFLIGRAFERLGDEPDALKIYLRLLASYPDLNEDSPLGTRIDNRVHWLLGDKSWMAGSWQEIAGRLWSALHTGDAGGLEKIISRDFEFGNGESDRLPVNFRSGARLIMYSARASRSLRRHDLPLPRPDMAVMEIAGWDDEHPVWYFIMHKREKPAAWEWDALSWNEPVR